MKKRLIAAACVLFWLAVWQVGAMLLGQELLLVSPVRAAGRLLELIPTEGFLRSVAFSSGRILGGFGLGLTCGTLLALLAGKFRFVRTLLAPLVAAVKAVPVASITVLAPFRRNNGGMRSEEVFLPFRECRFPRQLWNYACTFLPLMV